MGAATYSRMGKEGRTGGGPPRAVRAGAAGGDRRGRRGGVPAHRAVTRRPAAYVRTVAGYSGVPGASAVPESFEAFGASVVSGASGGVGAGVLAGFVPEAAAAAL